MQYITIPIELLRRFPRKWRAFVLFYRLKMVFGSKVEVSLFEDELARSPGNTERLIEDLKRWKLISSDGKMVFFRGRAFIEKRFNLTHKTRVRLFFEYTDRPIEFCYAAIVAYMVNFHSDPRKITRSGARDSHHWGGVSHSLIGAFCRRTKAWSSMMRKKAVAAGFLYIERRYLKTGYHAIDYLHLREAGLGYFLRSGTVFKEITSFTKTCLECVI